MESSETPSDTNKTVKEVRLKDLNQDDPALEKWLRYSSIYYIVVFIVIGLPIWYATTTTYRADLPFNDIEKLSNTNLELQRSFQIIYFDSSLKSQLSQFEKDFLNKLYERSYLSERFKLSFKASARIATENERNAAKKFKNLHVFDNTVSESRNINELFVYFLDDETAKRYEISSEIKLLNAVFLNQKTSSIQSLVDKICASFLKLDSVKDILKSKQDLRRKLPSKDQLRVVDFDSEYELTFTLVNSKPEAFEIEWDIEDKTKKTFSSVIEQLSPYTKFTMKSQRLFYTEFDSYRFTKSPSDQNYYLSPSDLSIMTNFIETRLGAQLTQDTTLNFVTYIPPKQPLKIKPATESQQSSSAFLVPRWGGIYIYNHLSEPDISMDVFMTQFLKLVGIKLNDNEVRDKLYMTEISSYIEIKTLENILNSINTLKSLASLLEQISNMVIADEIGEKVHVSVNSLKLAIEKLSSGDLEAAFGFSKTAFLSSEKAFFDPSLLQLLYFPEDQKFAIYVPLFIPVGLPVLLSLKTLIAWYKGSKKEKKD